MEKGITQIMPPITDAQWAEMDYWDSLEEQWRDSLPHYHITQLMEIFADSKDVMIRCFKEQIKRHKQELSEISEQIRKETTEEVAWDDTFWQDIIIARLSAQYDSIEKNIEQLQFRIRVLQGHEIKDKITEDDIHRAKQIPISEFYQGRLRRSGGILSGLCPFHTEKTPSFTIKVSTNRFKCFGCGEFGDSIDFVARTNNYKLPEDFLKVIKLMIGK